MANSIFIWPGPVTFSGAVTVGGALTVTGQILAADGTAGAPSYSFASDTDTGGYRIGTNQYGITVGGTAAANFFLSGATPGFQMAATGIFGFSDGDAATGNIDTKITRDAANTLALRNGTNAQAFRVYGYLSGARLAYGAIQEVTTAVTLSGATTTTGNVIPAGATVLDVSTSTTTAITGASGYQVGDGSTATRYGDITGTALGTHSGSTDYTADPRWWTNAARAITLTAKTSNFTGGVVQVCVLYTSAVGA